jgi:hypothetical protein
LPNDKKCRRAEHDHDSPTDMQFRPYQEAVEHELVSTRDPAHVPVVIWRITTRRPTHSAAGISMQQNMNWSHRETQLMSWS